MNYNRISCAHKECVDPMVDDFFKDHNTDYHKWLTYPMTSDEMFASMPEVKKFDIIFIDGLHLEEQVDKDIFNSMKHLNPNGMLVIHDCLPEHKEHQFEKRETKIWNGSVWKSLPKLEQFDIPFVTVDTDYGVGIVHYGVIDHLPERSKLTWTDYKNNRNRLMHVIPEDVFSKISSYD